MQSVGALTWAGRARARRAACVQSRRRRGTSEAAIDEARTRLAHTAAVASAATRAADTLIVDSLAFLNLLWLRLTDKKSETMRSVSIFNFDARSSSLVCFVKEMRADMSQKLKVRTVKRSSEYGERVKRMYYVELSLRWRCLCLYTDNITPQKLGSTSRLELKKK